MKSVKRFSFWMLMCVLATTQAEGAETRHLVSWFYLGMPTTEFSAQINDAPPNIVTEISGKCMVLTRQLPPSIMSVDASSSVQGFFRDDKLVQLSVKIKSEHDYLLEDFLNNIPKTWTSGPNNSYFHAIFTKDDIVMSIRMDKYERDTDDRGSVWYTQTYYQQNNSAYDLCYAKNRG